MVEKAKRTNADKGDKSKMTNTERVNAKENIIMGTKAGRWLCQGG